MATELNIVFLFPCASQWVHSPYLRLIHMFVSKSLNKALDTIKPDMVVR